MAATYIELGHKGQFLAGTSSDGTNSVSAPFTQDVNIVTGTTAASLGKAEDAVAASGDTGVMALAVRADTAAATAANGDYHPQLVDGSGRTWVHVGANETGGALTDRSGTITSGGTSQQLAAANSSRRYLFIQNNSAGDLWINFTTTPAVLTQPSIRLPAGADMTFEGSFVTTELVSIIGATTGQTFTAKEG